MTDGHPCRELLRLRFTGTGRHIYPQTSSHEHFGICGHTFAGAQQQHIADNDVARGNRVHG
jgi:hypothetical protein